LFAALKKHLKGIHFTCDEEVQAAVGKWFLEQLEEFYSDGFKKTCSSLAGLYETRGRLCGIVRYRNRVRIMSYILCFVLIHCLGVNIQT
jgi:hypothetical protein